MPSPSPPSPYSPTLTSTLPAPAPPLVSGLDAFRRNTNEEKHPLDLPSIRTWAQPAVPSGYERAPAAREPAVSTACSASFYASSCVCGDTPPPPPAPVPAGNGGAGTTTTAGATATRRPRPPLPAPTYVPRPCLYRRLCQRLCFAERSSNTRRSSRRCASYRCPWV